MYRQCDGTDMYSVRTIPITEFDEATVVKESKLLDNRKDRKAYKVVNCDCGLLYDDAKQSTYYPHERIA